MGTSTGYIMTISNSIIGVSVLAMPFCFKQCGIVLSSLLLILSNILSRSTCHFLLKSAIISRRRNYELLAFHVFGSMGKTFVELSIIGFMMGTCIAFFVVMGDLGPAILSNVFTHIRIETLRPTVLMGLAVFIVLPLGLLRNVESLSTVSAATILFYLCLVLKMIAESSTHLIQGDWMYQVKYWQPDGLLQCLPIFSMALFCQTQLFDIFESMPSLSLDRMNLYIGSAVNMCTAVYMSVGFFGYVAYYKMTNLSGNVLLSFTPNPSSEMIKFGFVLSVAVSFPLVIFPCRASIYSFLFRKGHTSHYEGMSHAANAGGSHIPESRFRCITLFIIFVALFTAMMSSNIELVLGLVGATIGVLICVLLPTYIFVRVSGGKPTTERMFAKFIFITGLCIMVLGTYANLSATDKSESAVTSVPSMFIVKDSNQGEVMKLAETMAINNNFMLQEIDNKIEKPNLETNKEVNQMRVDYDKKLSEERNEKVRGNEKIGNLPVVPDQRLLLRPDNQEVAEQKLILSPNEGVVNVNKDIANEKVDGIQTGNHTVHNEDVLINHEAIKKEEKEAQNEIPHTKASEEKNRELEILEKLKKQGEDQAKIIKQQEIILKEVIRQNKQLEEIKQKEKESKVEQGNVPAGNSKGVNGRNAASSKDVNNIGNIDKKIETMQQAGMGLVSHLNVGKSVSNNLISEKILELNENIRELNRDEVKLSRQIDKVKQNIELEKLKEIDSGKSGMNKHVGDLPPNVVGVGANIGGNNERKVDIVSTDVQAEQNLQHKSPVEVQSPIGNIDVNVPNVNLGKDINQAGNVVSKEPVASIGDNQNNIESPPNNEGKLIPPNNNNYINNIPPNNDINNNIKINNKNILNEEYIEVKKNLSKKETVRSDMKPAVPIALMLQPSEPKDTKPSDIVKTRDILEEHKRDKRDVRVEPVNPVPPEYETIKHADRTNQVDARDERIIQDAVAVIAKKNEERNVESAMDGQILKDAVAVIEKNNALDSGNVDLASNVVDNVIDGQHESTKDKVEPKMGVGSVDEKNIQKNNKVKVAASPELLDVPANSDAVIEDQSVEKVKNVNIVYEIKVDSNVQQVPVDENKSQNPSQIQALVKNEVEHVDAGTIKTNNTAEQSNNTETLIRTSSSEVGVETANAEHISLSNNKTNIEIIQNDTVNKANSDLNIVNYNPSNRNNIANNANSNSAVPSLSSSNTLNEDKLVHSNGASPSNAPSNTVVNSNSAIHSNSPTNIVNSNRPVPSDSTSNTLVHFNSAIPSATQDGKHNMHPDEVSKDNRHLDEVSKGNENQNEQCEVSDGSDIRVPQLLSNLNPPDLMQGLPLDRQLKDHLNMAADKN